MDFSKLIERTIEAIDDTVRIEKSKENTKKHIDKITYGQFQILALIFRLGNPSMSEMAKELHITNPSMTAHINRLVKSGMVYKQRSKTDKRVWYIHLTELAKTVESAEIRAFNIMEDTIKSRLDGVEQEQLHALITKVLGDDYADI